MAELQKLSRLVTDAYQNSGNNFALWMLKNHVPLVAKKTEELARHFGADADIAVAGAWLHDFGDAFVHRHADKHEEISEQEATKILKLCEFSADQIESVLIDVIAPHSCKNGFLPTKIEGKVMATADAFAHLTTDFYIQFSWMHLPENKSYSQFIDWVNEKLERDFHKKIFFSEVKDEVRQRYQALKEVFST